MSMMEFLDPLEAKKFTNQKCIKFCLKIFCCKKGHICALFNTKRIETWNCDAVFIFYVSLIENLILILEVVLILEDAFISNVSFIYQVLFIVGVQIKYKFHFSS